jgi:hypothetical protein
MPNLTFTYFIIRPIFNKLFFLYKKALYYEKNIIIQIFQIIINSINIK